MLNAALKGPLNNYMLTGENNIVDGGRQLNVRPSSSVFPEPVDSFHYILRVQCARSSRSPVSTSSRHGIGRPDKVIILPGSAALESCRVVIDTNCCWYWPTNT